MFPIDARLRPHGREGELIVTPAQLETYFREEAKPWEALTYVKLRYVAGDRALANRVMKRVQEDRRDGREAGVRRRAGGSANGWNTVNLRRT